MDINKKVKCNYIDDKYKSDGCTALNCPHSIEHKKMDSCSYNYCYSGGYVKCITVNKRKNK